MTVVEIAAVCHDANRMYSRTLGDTSHAPWEDTPRWQRQSAQDGVQYLVLHPGATPADLHHNWSMDKIAEGWTWGPTKDADAKTHPCLVPWESLPEAQRRKDLLFGAIVEALTRPW